MIEEERFEGGEIFYVVSRMSFDGDERFIVIAQQSRGVEDNFFGVEENGGAIEENFFVMALENSASALLWFDLSQTNGVIVVRQVRDTERRFYC